MPRKNKNKKSRTSRRRVNRRKNIRKFRPTMRTTFIRGDQFTSDSLWVTLRYVVPFTWAASVVNGYVLRGNGPYDPDVTLTGGQPVGYDSWDSLYGKYYVAWSRVKMTVTTIGSGQPFCVSIYPSITTTPASEAFSASCQPFATSLKMSSESTSNSRLTVQKRMSTSMFFGKPTNQDENYASVTSGVPNIQWYWMIMATTCTLSDNVTANGLLEVWYRIRFYNRRQLDFSLLNSNRKLTPFSAFFLKGGDMDEKSEEVLL